MTAPQSKAGERMTDRERALVEAARAFANVRDQFPESAKLISKKMDGFTPVQITVTKAQFLALSAALSQYEEPPPNEQCPAHPGHRCQVDTSMESGPNNCFHCERPMR